VRKPLAVDLACGLGGWTEGLLAEGWDVVGFDIERHVYGEHRYPAQLVLQDILTLDGRQFRGKVQLIVASPPCQFFSYTAMPWTRAKELAKAVRADPVRLANELALFNACVRIGKEAECPIVIENVRGAIPWVGKARWHYGSYYLWGDVPALMPMTARGVKVGGITFNGYGTPGYKPVAFNGTAEQRMREDDGAKNPGFRFDGSGKSFQSESVDRATKNTGGSWFNIGSPGQKIVNQNPVHDGTKVGKAGSKSSARKAASARIAMIPLALARHIARAYYPVALGLGESPPKKEDGEAWALRRLT
jgi:hypothetical protein